MPGPWWKQRSHPAHTPPLYGGRSVPHCALMRVAVRHPLLCVRQPIRPLDRSCVRGEENQNQASGIPSPPPPTQPALPPNRRRRSKCSRVLQSVPGHWLTLHRPLLFSSCSSFSYTEPDLPPCASIWFDFMEMFILLSKYPFIALGMELDVLLDWAGQITTGRGKLLPCPKK